MDEDTVPPEGPADPAEAPPVPPDAPPPQPPSGETWVAPEAEQRRRGAGL